ncbi:MAG: hypothetical protein VX899_02150 [Myxococcota bacterium]|nr:hypothetical protein [Myxococcota bacterium]
MPQWATDLGSQIVGAADQTALGFRGIVGLLGGLLALAGARLYKLSILAPGIVLGLFVGTLLPGDIDAAIRAVVAVVLAGLGALLCRFVERAAVSVFGAVLTGGLAYTLYPLFQGEPSPWWLPAAAAGLGLLLFPKLFHALLRPLTAILGGLLVSVAVGQPGHPLVIGGVAAVGMVVQFSAGRKKDSKTKD